MSCTRTAIFSARASTSPLALEGLAEPGGVCVARNVYDAGPPPIASRVRAHGPATPQEYRRARRGLAACIPRTKRGRRDVGRYRASDARHGSRRQPSPCSSLRPAPGGNGGASSPPTTGPRSPSCRSPTSRVTRGGSGSADGITEDVITRLARHPDFFVIARNSVLPYKGKPVDIRQVGRDLGVRYVLEGGLQEDGGRVRVTAQLLDATTGAHVWAERYDRPEADLFAVQDEVVDEVVGALGGWTGKIAAALRAQAHRKPPASLRGLRPLPHRARGQARLHAREVAGSHHHAPKGRGTGPGLRARLGGPGPRLQRRDHERVRRRPDHLQPALDRVHREGRHARPGRRARADLGLARAFQGDIAAADAEYRAALSLAPNDADILALVGWVVPSDGGASPTKPSATSSTPSPSTPRHRPGTSLAWAWRNSLAARTRPPLRRSSAPSPVASPSCTWRWRRRCSGGRRRPQYAAQLTSESPNFTIEGYIRDGPVVPVALIATICEGAVKAGLLPTPTH